MHGRRYAQAKNGFWQGKAGGSVVQIDEMAAQLESLRMASAQKQQDLQSQVSQLEGKLRDWQGEAENSLLGSKDIEVWYAKVIRAPE